MKNGNNKAAVQEKKDLERKKKFQGVELALGGAVAPWAPLIFAPLILFTALKLCKTGYNKITRIVENNTSYNSCRLKPEYSALI